MQPDDEKTLCEGKSFLFCTDDPTKAREALVKLLFGEEVDYDGKASTWLAPDDCLLWMVSFDGVIRKGWKNYFVSDEELYQENVFHKWIRPKDLHLTRAVFSATTHGSQTDLVFKGLYVYEEEKSDLGGKMYFRKVASEYGF